MKMKKSAVGIMLLVMVMIGSMSPTAVFADSSNISESIMRVQQLGILSSTGVEDLNSDITRGQLVEALVAAADLADSAENLIGSTIFPDIDPNSNLSGYVNAVIGKGLMYGMPDGYFHPERGVTYAEACTIMVKLLGYTDADVAGVWPSNYINKASELELTKGMKFKRNDKVNVVYAAVMFSNLLDTNHKLTGKKFSETIALYSDYVILDDSTTDSKLSSNAVRTDKGVLYLLDSNTRLQVGNKYRLKVEDGNINKVYGTTKETVSITLDSIIENTIYYKDNFVPKSMNIPAEPTYYHLGQAQAYNTVSSTLKPNSIIVFAYNDDKTGFEYAVIIDPLYSKPEVAVNFDANADSLGSITFDPITKVMKNGEAISKQDIEELDVVYSVTNIYGNNRTIVVFDGRTEGTIKAFGQQGGVPTSITIDANAALNFSKDMNLGKLSSFKAGDKVAALLDYNGKLVVDVVKIDYKTTEKEVKILGNSKTISELTENQVRTDQGDYYLLNSVGDLEIGGKYKVSVDDAEATIVKVKKNMNSLDIFSVRRVEDNTVYYGGGSEPASMILPRIATYYYGGKKTDYSTVLSSLSPSSSIVLAKVDGKYEYGIIADPIYSKPLINNLANIEKIRSIDVDDYMFINRDGSYVNGTSWLEQSDVVYTISDLWDINKFIYVTNNAKVRGRVSAQPTLSPSNITISVGGKDTVYSFSKYFDKSKISTQGIVKDKSVTIILDREQKIIDMYLN